MARSPIATEDANTPVIAAAGEQWKVEYARFFSYPSLSLTGPSLGSRRDRFRGIWLSPSPSLASIGVVSDQFKSDFILTVSFLGEISEEHYVSNLRFSWPQLSSVSGFPTRGSRTLIISHGDNEEQMQKFALRFKSMYEVASFADAVKTFMERPMVDELLKCNLLSEMAIKSEFFPSDETLYRPKRDWNTAAMPDSCTQEPVPKQEKPVSEGKADLRHQVMVLARIWSVLADHFISAGSHCDEKIAVYTIDSLRQHFMKYLERGKPVQNDIALLCICEDCLAEGLIDVNLDITHDVTEHLAGLSDLTSDPRPEVRNRAVGVLSDLLNERGSNFSETFWKSIFHRVLFPIFDHVRYAGKEKSLITSDDDWLRENTIQSLQLLCNLFNTFDKEVCFMLAPLLSLLLDCAKKTDQSVVSISLGALVNLIGGHQFSDSDWDTLLKGIRDDASYATQPLELLNAFSFETPKGPYMLPRDVAGVGGNHSMELEAPKEHPSIGSDGTMKNTNASILTDQKQESADGSVASAPTLLPKLFPKVLRSGTGKDMMLVIYEGSTYHMFNPKFRVGVLREERHVPEWEAIGFTMSGLVLRRGRGELLHSYAYVHLALHDFVHYLPSSASLMESTAPRGNLLGVYIDTRVEDGKIETFLCWTATNRIFIQHHLTGDPAWAMTVCTQGVDKIPRAMEVTTCLHGEGRFYCFLGRYLLCSISMTDSSAWTFSVFDESLTNTNGFAAFGIENLGYSIVLLVISMDHVVYEYGILEKDDGGLAYYRDSDELTGAVYASQKNGFQVLELPRPYDFCNIGEMYVAGGYWEFNEATLLELFQRDDFYEFSRPLKRCKFYPNQRCNHPTSWWKTKCLEEEEDEEEGGYYNVK